MYYLNCECDGTFVVWSSKRQPTLSGKEVGRRLKRALAVCDLRQPVLILSSPIRPDTLAATAPVSVTLLREFASPGSWENYWVYGVQSSGLPCSD
jgi:hypothetical protein